ncbi:hypothetical protein GIB67_013148 [Kingdonia uniflora]|uniref:Uncharacterized protein n=1 Tax=Kingdonia uniflora TaxID=39325 RepID=A0A7J7LPT3_9MAGN|nr:hypothetical protein GIB67_013148 [Kingdonia uniflora]
MPVLRGHGLVGFVDGAHPCPNEFLPDSEGKETAAVNPKYMEWHRQDQNLLSWINATLSETVLPYVVGFPTFEIVWATLDRRFSALSRSHIIQLKDQIHFVKKGTFSASEYLLNIKQLSDRLASVGKPMDDADFVIVILNGLPSEFASIKTSVKVRHEPVTFDELDSFLICEELSIVASKTSLPPTDSTTFIASRGANQQSLCRASFRPNLPYNPQRGRGKGRTYSGRGGRSNGGSHTVTSINRPTCQICNRVGHIAIDCYHRNDYPFQGGRNL